MGASLRVFAGLVAGLAAGVAVAALDTPALHAGVAIVEPIGALWLNAIRMTVVPLVVSLLIVAVASRSGATTVRNVGGGAIALFGLFAAAAGTFALIASPPVLDLIFENAPAVGTLSAAPIDHGAAPPFREWLVNIIPANPIRAAADGAMLPLVVFSVIFGVALGRVDAAHTFTLPFFSAAAEALLLIVAWIIALAPLGVFALVLPLASQVGPAMVGVLGSAALAMCALVLATLLALYPVAAIGGRVPLRRFARACVPAQAVAFGTRSSLAALPAQITGARDALGIDRAVTGLVLPLAVAVFKFATPVARITGTFFVARLFGIELGPSQIVAIAAALTALSFYAPGVPSGTLLVAAPVYQAFGIPLEGIGLLIGLDAIVDSFTTTGNVTANMTVALLLAQRGTHPSAVGAPEIGSPAVSTSLYSEV